MVTPRYLRVFSKPIIDSTQVREKNIRTIFGCLHSNLFIIIPTHWGFIYQMNYTCNRTTSALIVAYININIMY